MIQRIQSLYLSLITLFSILFLSSKMIRFRDEEGNMLYAAFSGLNKINGAGGAELMEKVLPLAVILILIASLALFTIFIFKNRKLQIKVAVVLMILSLLLIFGIAYYLFALSAKYNAEVRLSLNLILPLLILVCSILAYRGIKKDEQLVKSYDRLR